MEFPQRLIDGYNAFLGERLPREQNRFHELAEMGQHPEIMVIGCADSRVPPEIIFDAHPGELFVVRNVANIVPPYAPDEQAHGVSAALEFAVGALRVKHIVVLGHAHCGGIKAFAEDAAPLSTNDFIGHWMKLMAPAIEKVPRAGALPGDYLMQLELANIVNSLYNLRTFPQIDEQIARGAIKTHGAYFGIATGTLSVLDWESSAFRHVATEEHAKALQAPRL